MILKQDAKSTDTHTIGQTLQSKHGKNRNKRYMPIARCVRFETLFMNYLNCLTLEQALETFNSSVSTSSLLSNN